MKPRISIEPSILSADFTRLGQQAKEAEDAGVEGIQIDVMDGHFVPNLTFGPGVVKALRKSVALFLDAHLMIDNPHSFLEEFALSGADRIIVHEEVCKDLPTVLKAIKKLKVEAGVAINPETPVTTVERVLDAADCVQVMTVHPGFSGQRFMEDQLSKIQRLRQEIDQRHLKASIVVDGGIDAKTAPLAVKSGATVLVAGSSVYNQSAPVAQNVLTLRNSIAATVAAIGSD
ncbi:ribulose-phosphate 3-epimerase [archaeon 13_1_40CM_2_52_13]|nr:MAG: ribulose-phosphate 3-epimerase [archaeon 13_1_40CM_2_52_13]OLE70759.1 MAG: ribulose-phosphate 3-epimerase [archaeon 13_1_20CM_2_51_12]TMI41716.1 MAG: ribulose-phosphate 3-epimerase [Candidatus Bathyarchaeota archaeon]